MAASSNPLGAGQNNAQPPRDALKNVWSSPDVERGVIEAYDRLSSVVWQAWQQSMASVGAADRQIGYRRRVNEAFATPDKRARVEMAFRQYVVDLVAAWKSIDPDTTTPEDLAAISEGMRWVIGVVSVVHEAGERNP
jgi:hypothetical protein